MQNTAISTQPRPSASRLSLEWSAFLAMVRKELIVLSRYPVQFVSSFGQVFLIISIFSLAATMFTPEGEQGASAVTAGVTTYGFVMFIFFSDTLWTIGYNIREEQLQGTLEQLYLSPASKFASLIARVTNLLVWTSLLVALSVLVMSLFLGRLPFQNPLLALYILALSLMGTFGVGFAFAALTLRIKETAQVLVNLFQFAFMIVGANFFPFAALPAPLLFVSRLLPLAYSVDAFRSTLMGYPAGYPELAPLQVELVIITVFGLLMPLIGYWLYRRAEDHARRSGSLAQF